MGKLYAITDGEYSEYHIIAVCSDKEKAENIVKIHGGSIEEYEDGVTWDDMIKAYEITFFPRENYRIRWEYCDNPHEHEFGKIKKEMIKTSITTYEKCKIYVWAYSEEHAEKIARDKLAEYRARELGI